MVAALLYGFERPCPSKRKERAPHVVGERAEGPNQGPSIALYGRTSPPEGVPTRPPVVFTQGHRQIELEHALLEPVQQDLRLASDHARNRISPLLEPTRDVQLELENSSPGTVPTSGIGSRAGEQRLRGPPQCMTVTLEGIDGGSSGLMSSDEG